MNQVQTSPLIPLDSLQRVNEALDFCKSVEVVEIKTNDQYLNATKLFRELGGYIKGVDDERKKVKEPFLQKGREIDSWFKDPSTALLSLKSKLDPAIRAYEREVERKRIEEQNRLNAEAEARRKKAEEAAAEERRKAEEKRREADRIAQEDAARATELRRQADAADVRADAKEDKAETIVAPVAQAAIPKAEGISKRANWKMEITNPFGFIKWCVENGQTNLLMPNPQACKAQAGVIRQNQTFSWGKIYNDESLTGRSI